MKTKFNSLMKRPVVFLALWTLILFLALLLSIFLHEVGHGFGARLQGIHVSTGFNQVGDYGKSPQDPDFRSSTSQESVLGGLLGPLLSWGLAILFTVWLFRFKKPSWGALTVNAMAITNGLVRALPVLAALVNNLLGTPRMEDEVQWGMWVVMKYCHPPSLPSSMGFHAMLNNYPDVFFREPVFWVAPLISLMISLACLIPACVKTVRLWRNDLRPVVMWLFALLPFAVHYAFRPLQDILDRSIRINW